MSAHALQEPAPACRCMGNVVVLGKSTSVLGVCVDTVATWIARADQRRALRCLAEEGRLLSDVGFTRQQALREAGKPFWCR